MSLFSWFSRKPAPIVPPKGTGQSRPQLHPSSRPHSRNKSASDAASPLPDVQPGKADQRKHERLQRREALAKARSLLG